MGAHPTAQQVHRLLNEDVIKERKSLLSVKHSGAWCFGGTIRGSMLVQHLKQQERGDSTPVPYSGRVSLVWRSFLLAPSYLVSSLLSFKCGFACCDSVRISARGQGRRQALSLWGRVDATRLQCSKTGKQTYFTVCKQTTEKIHSLISWGVTESR